MSIRPETYSREMAMRDTFLFAWGILWRFTFLGVGFGVLFGALYSVLIGVYANIMAGDNLPTDKSYLWSLFFVWLTAGAIGAWVGGSWGLMMGFIEGSLFTLATVWIWRSRLTVPEWPFRILGLLYGTGATVLWIVVFTAVIPESSRYELYAPFLMPQTSGDLLNQSDVLIEWGLCILSSGFVGFLTAGWAATALRTRLRSGPTKWIQVIRPIFRDSQSMKDDWYR